MSNKLSLLATEAVHLPLAAFLVWLLYHRLWRRRIPSLVSDAPFRAWRVLAIIGLAAMLAGCSNADPLAVASGPVFQLNPGHWQPSKEALAAPPNVVAD